MKDIKLYKIVQIGVGGTGGYLVPHLTRMLKCQDARWDYTLVDPDIVEEVNLSRQNFIRQDLGQYKSQVMAKRYSMGLEATILSSTERLEAPEQIIRWFAPAPNDGYTWIPPTLNILIGCVDNNAARRVMNQFYEEYDGFGRLEPLVYMDSGNGRFDGQVVVAFKRCKEKGSPSPGTLFPDLLKPDPANTNTNCAQRAAEDPQNIMGNIFASAALLATLSKIIQQKQVGPAIIPFDAAKAFMRGSQH